MALGLGVVVRTGWAVAVAVRGRRVHPGFAGRWYVELVPEDLPRQPYHAAVEMPVVEGESLVNRVEDAASSIARDWVKGIVVSLPGPRELTVVANPGVRGPATVADGFRTHTAMHAAEAALYRDCLVDAAATIGLPAQVLSTDELPTMGDAVQSLGSTAGRPWRREHKDAARAALLRLR